MVEDSNQDISAKMLLRYRVVSAVKVLMLGGLKRSMAVSAAAEQVFPDDEGNVHRFSRRSVQRWCTAFAEKGVDGLRDESRKRCDSSVVLKPEFLAYLKKQKSEDPHASIPELLRRAREAGTLHPAEVVDRTTVWRALRRMGVATRRMRKVEVDDKRRFAFVERMQMVLVDFKHFRAGPTRAKRLAIYFLDDATRFGLGVLVGTEGEKPIYTLRGLLQVFKTYGVMLALYLDGGSGFKAHDVHAVLQRFEIPFIHGTANYPEGHGKIERFNRSALARVLRSFDGADWLDPDPDALTLRLRHDLFQEYNHLPHEGLGGDTPYQRWQASKRELKTVPSEPRLDEAFIIEERRTVSNDHCIPFRSVAYEVPMGLSGRRITIERALLENDALYLRHNGKRIRLHPVDLAFNARSGRARGGEVEDEPSGSLPKNASSLSFDAEFGSILLPDGGFPDEEDADDVTTNHMEEDDGE
jgi:putative transposase